MKHLLKTSVGAAIAILAFAGTSLADETRTTIQFAKGPKLSGSLQSIEPTGIWMSSTEGRVWIAAKDLSMADRVRFGYGTPEERAQVAEAKAAAAEKAAQDTIKAAELQRQREAYIARMEAREQTHRQAAVAAKELELREREVQAAEDAANELRKFRMQMQLDAMAARGEQGVIVDYGPRRK